MGDRKRLTAISPSTVMPCVEKGGGSMGLSLRTCGHYVLSRSWPLCGLASYAHAFAVRRVGVRARRRGASLS